MSAVESLMCPKCGADLDVPDGVTVLKCRFCGSKLQLKETGSVRALALIDQKLESIDHHARRTADGVERLATSHDLARDKARVRWQEKLNEMKESIPPFLEKIENANRELEVQLEVLDQQKRKGYWTAAAIFCVSVFTSALLLANASGGGDTGNTSGITFILAVIIACVVAVFLSKFREKKESERQDAISVNRAGVRAIEAMLSEVKARIREWENREPL